MSKHTPGPWTITEDDTRITAVHPLRKHSYEIVTVHYAFQHDQFRANAKLIAAAPDLAEALQTLVDLETKQHRPEVAAKAFADARAALAKAGV